MCAAIPCAQHHWGPLLQRSLRSVAKQTRRVDQVVVAVSLVGLSPEARERKCAARQTQLSTWFDGAKLVCVEAVKGSRTHAANRNVAGRQCGNATWVAFIDADDEMQPERVMRMIDVMRRAKADIGLHSYVYRQSQPRLASLSAVSSATTYGAHLPAGSREPTIRSPSVLYRAANASSRRFMLMAPLNCKTHHGHSFVRRSVLSEVPQPEEKEQYRQEDVAWVDRSMRAGVRVVHTDEELSVYYSGSSVAPLLPDQA